MYIWLVRPLSLWVESSEWEQAAWRHGAPRQGASPFQPQHPLSLSLSLSRCSSSDSTRTTRFLPSFLAESFIVLVGRKETRRARRREGGGILAYTDTEPGEVWRRALHEHDDANRSCGGRFFTDGVAQRRPVLLLRRRCPEPEQEPARQDGRQLRRRGLRSALFLSGCQAAWPSHQLRCRQADGRVRPQPREQQLRVPQSLHPHPLRLHR